MRVARSGRGQGQVWGGERQAETGRGRWGHPQAGGEAGGGRQRQEEADRGGWRQAEAGRDRQAGRGRQGSQQGEVCDVGLLGF